MNNDDKRSRRRAFRKIGAGLATLVAVGISSGEAGAADHGRNPFTLTYEGAIMENEPGKVNIHPVRYNLNGLEIAANVYTPANHDPTKKHPAVVVAHPNGGVKEQVAGLYAQRLAERGYVTIAADAAYQGASGGQPRSVDKPAYRIEDIHGMADHVTRHPGVDGERLGLLGICGGGGYALAAAQTDKRFKSIATLSMFNTGRVRRNGYADSQRDTIQKRLRQASEARAREAADGNVSYAGDADLTDEEIAALPFDLYREGYRYYRKTHAHPGSTFKYTMGSLLDLMRWDATDQIEMIDQPLLMIAGGKADSLYMTEDAFKKATGTKDKELFEIDGATHVETYWVPKYVDAATDKLTAFFARTLIDVGAHAEASGRDESADSPAIVVNRAADQPSESGPEENFTGSVRVDSRFQTPAPGRVGGGVVTFEPGARTAWHAHPMGQTLIVTAGVGRVQKWGGPIQEIRPGDVAWIPPDVKHWHGAGPTTGMTHVAIAEQLDGKGVDWLEKVDDAQYGGPTSDPEGPAGGGAATRTRAQSLFGDVNPKLAQLTDDVLYGDVWNRPGLSKRDRSLVTVSALIAMNRPDQLRSHLALALTNGVTREELVEVTTHLAFYAGWPSGVTAAGVAKEVFAAPPTAVDASRQAPIPIREQGSFSVGGTVVTSPGTFDPKRPGPEGQTLHADHASVFYQVPANPRELPLVMWHGFGQFARTWGTTPDGREGYQNIFLRRRFPVYLIDQPRRGGAGRSTVAGTITAQPDDQQWFNTFRFGEWPEFFPGARFSRDPAALEQFFRQTTPDTGPLDAKVAVSAVSALFDKIGPGILVTHSQGGGFGWRVAMGNKNVRAVVSYEPGSGFVFPEGEAPPPMPSASGPLEAASVPLDEFMALTRIPIVIYYGDNIPAEPTDNPGRDNWRVRLTMARLWAEAVNRKGGDVTLVHLPEVGIRGNTHFPFSDLNNAEIADLMSRFLAEKGLDGDEGARAGDGGQRHP